MIKTVMHNRYELFVINEEGEITQQAIAFNEANSENYLKAGYISKLFLIGDNRERYIEPTAMGSTYWERSGEPYREGQYFFANYKAVVYFPIEAGSTGTITGFRLTDNIGTVISDAPLVDIDGRQIVLNYDKTSGLRVHIYIHFTTYIPRMEEDIYPIKYFQPSNSIFCGCCGRQSELLERIRRKTAEEGVSIIDGYLPYNTNMFIGLSKSLVPKYDEEYNILYGGINDYVLINSERILSTLKNLKNVLVPNSLKGLIRSIILPGVGIIDLLEKNIGPFKEGILLGTKVTDQSICYVPEEYVEEGACLAPISIKHNAFYKANKIQVLRWKIVGGEKNVVEIENMTEPYNGPSCNAFFSDGITDERLQRCLSFSQHIPLTEYYCGAESVIPCSPSSGFSGTPEEDNRYYGYDLIFKGKTDSSEDISFSHCIAASYIVCGEVITMTTNDYVAKTFPCKVEYSYNGIDFYTAVEVAENDTPYTKINFNNGTIVAPIWKISSTINGYTCMKANNTTHSDKYIADICINRNENVNTTRNLCGYDPLFLFIGFEDNGYYIPPEVEIDSQIIQEALNIAKEITGDFSYPESMITTSFTTKTPYLYHSNDSIYFSGSLLYGSQWELNTIPV